MNSYNMVYSSELAHHGILGQKWGVRRYQNFDGSLTRAGLARYNTSKDNYETLKNAYKSSKKINGKTVVDPNTGEEKTTNFTKDHLKAAKMVVKRAKRQMNKDYRHLKQDKLADQGKELYKNGNTITGNHAATKALGTVGGLAIYAAVSKSLPIHSATVKNALKVIGSTAITAATAKEVSDAYKARRLRAYYTHIKKHKMQIENVVNNDNLMNTPINQQIRRLQQESMRQSINANLQGASLSMSGGMNPFMFGRI